MKERGAPDVARECNTEDFYRQGACYRNESRRVALLARRKHLEALLLISERCNIAFYGIIFESGTVSSFETDDEKVPASASTVPSKLR